MDEPALIFSAVILIGIAWIVLRVGKRQARNSMRILAMHKGGLFRPGGLFGHASATIPHGGTTVRVTVRSLGWFGGRFLATFEANWLPPRPDLAQCSPGSLAIPSAAGQGSALPRPISPELQVAVERLCQSQVATDHAVYTKHGTFFSHSILATAATTQVIHWFELSLRIYNLLAAETEAGIEFAGAPTSAAADALCQVCGTPPEPQDTVYCDSCGAPHHAECWQYNRGCAIYGCRRQG